MSRGLDTTPLHRGDDRRQLRTVPLSEHHQGRVERRHIDRRVRDQRQRRLPVSAHVVALPAPAVRAPALRVLVAVRRAVLPVGPQCGGHAGSESQACRYGQQRPAGTLTPVASRTVCTVCGREVGAVLNWEKLQAGRLVGEYRVARHVYDPHSRKTGNRAMCPGGGILIDARQLSPSGRPAEAAGTRGP